VAARFAAGPRDITETSTTRFEIAISCLLDGLEARLEATPLPWSYSDLARAWPWYRGDLAS
jgi:hypothetical protein